MAITIAIVSPLLCCVCLQVYVSSYLSVHMTSVMRASSKRLNGKLCQMSQSYIISTYIHIHSEICMYNFYLYSWDTYKVGINENIESRGEGATLLHSTINHRGGREIIIYFYDTIDISI